MPSTAIIDVDLDLVAKNNYYALEESAIWKTANLLAVGVSTWTKVYDGATFTGGTGLKLTRIRCAYPTANLVYAIGVAEKSTGVFALFCFVSRTAGLTWAWYEICEVADPANSFTFLGTDGADANNLVSSWSGGGVSVNGGFSIGNHSFPNTEKYAQVSTDEDINTGTIALHYQVLGTYLSTDYDADGDKYPLVSIPGQFPTGVTVTPITGGVDIAGSIYMNPIVADKKRLDIGYFYGQPGRWAASSVTSRACVVKLISIGNLTFGALPGIGFDVAQSNNNWLYVGTEAKIMKSTDGGVTWVELNTDAGATDICVDPQAAGVIYYWDTNGSLYYIVDTVRQAALLTGSPIAFEPLRIARSPNSGKLWVIDGVALKMRNLGSWTTQVAAGMAGARSLRAYVGDKLVHVTTSDIWYSADGGAAWSAKKGAWGFASGVSVHLTE